MDVVLDVMGAALIVGRKEGKVVRRWETFYLNTPKYARPLASDLWPRDFCC
jgi:hypothetical protein